MVSNRFLGVCGALLLSGFIASPAQALTVTATAVDLPDAVAGQDLWRFDYLLTGPVQAFAGATLTFVVAEFSGLVVSASPPAADWLGAVTPGDASAPFDGVVQFTAQAALGAASSGQFSVDLVWAQPRQPFQQSIELFEDGGNVLSTGMQSVAIVPEPATAALFGAGALLVGAAGRYRRRRPPTALAV